MLHLISQHSCRALQFILPSPRGRSPSYSVEPITANTRATAPDMPPRSAGTNHHGGSVSFLSMITLPLSNRRYAWCCKAPAHRLMRSLARSRPVRRSLARVERAVRSWEWGVVAWASEQRLADQAPYNAVPALPPRG